MKINRLLTGQSLFKKLFFLLIISVYVPLLLVGYMTYTKSSEQIERMTAAFLDDNLAYNKSRIEEYLQEVERHSIAVYASGKLQQFLQKYKNGDLADFEYITGITPINTELSGSYYLSIYPSELHDFLNYSALQANSPVNGTDWHRQALGLGGVGFWMQEDRLDFTGVSSNLYYIRSIRSLKMPLFENMGVMTIRVPGKHIQDQLLLLERYPNHRIRVFDEKDRNLLEPVAGAAETAEWAKDNRLVGRNEFQVVRGTEGDFYMASTSIGDGGWKLVATIPTSDVNGPIIQLREFVWMILISSLSLIAILLAFITNSFTVPIRVVVSHMKKMNLGLLEYCVSFVARKDEIGQLVNGYNVMIQGMHELLDTTRTTEQEKRKLEIQMLMHQINPHFLYNTLDSIKWKAEVAGEKAIVEMTTLLADLLRFSLNEGDEMTTVEREIDHVKCYLSIELLRNSGAFQVMYNIHPEIINASYMKLTIQPIVENSVRHGMKKLVPGTGKILISMFPDGGDIVCVVEDNGPGVTDEAMEAMKKLQYDRQHYEHTGIGLLNVSKRLEANFGPRYELIFERPGRTGLRVTIRQPMKAPTP